MLSHPGLLLIDKPSGISSAQVVSRVKRTLQAPKVGHAGTLDPMATGLLIVLLNRATRIADFVQSGQKTYSGKILFGVSTSTDDIEGEVLSRSTELPDPNRIICAAESFKGEQSQLPPQISALKVQGRRSYELAREGQTVALEPRPVHISAFDLSILSASEAGFRVVCSKGTYVRSIARDLGAALGCGACISALRRERSEPFSVSDAVPLDALIPEHVRPWWSAFSALNALELTEGEVRRLSTGDQSVLAYAPDLPSGMYLYRTREGEPAGLLERSSTWKLVLSA